MTERDEILEGLRPLFEKAEREGLWFRSYYQDLWLSPAELHEEQAKGRLIWGAVNWELRDPRDKLLDIKSEINKLEQEYDKFKYRMDA